MIGASLSKPHTRVTALRMCMLACLWPYTNERVYYED